MSNTVRISTIYPLKNDFSVYYVWVFFFKYKQVTAIYMYVIIRV